MQSEGPVKKRPAELLPPRPRKPVPHGHRSAVPLPRPPRRPGSRCSCRPCTSSAPGSAASSVLKARGHGRRHQRPAVRRGPRRARRGRRPGRRAPPARPERGVSRLRRRGALAGPGDRAARPAPAAPPPVVQPRPHVREALTAAGLPGIRLHASPDVRPGRLTGRGPAAREPARAEPGGPGR
ncbi:hypothetical protein LT493_43145 [Streptomyces tricolor]|nr:hypothetical protein [Streptomyces tricolor]